MKVVTTLLHGAPVFGALLAAGFAYSQDNSTITLQVGPAAAAYRPGSLAYRALGLKGAKDAAPSTNAAHLAGEIPAITGAGFYPADVSNPGHVPAVVTTKHHPIYVDKPASHWGSVGTFLTDLGNSDFMHVVDQYTGSWADNRYTLGTSFLATYPIPANHTLQMSDILTLAHAGASIKGNGFGHIYHVFLPQGVDMCIDAVTCYSPDNPNTFVFCAFHGSVTFTDLGDVLYSVEPFQNVNGCSAPPTGTPNGQLIDSTNDTLSHETFEAISDPDLNSWWVQAFTFAYGNEIGRK